MNMKDCVSLEIAKKLKEAGWKQQDDQTFWAHFRGHHPDDWHLKEPPIIIGLDRDVAYAAPTIGELLSVLSEKANFGELNWNYHGKRCGGIFRYDAGKNVFLGIPERQENPADALALLWIKLKELGVV